MGFCMNKIYCIIFNTNDEILILNKNNEYSLPNISGYDSNKKRHLSKYLYDNLGLNVKKSYLTFKESYEKEEYFICEEPYEKDELNPNKELKKQITWISKRDLKDVLLSDKNNQFTNTLIDSLTKIFKSSFSFSNNERNALLNEMEKATDEGNILYTTYAASKAMCLISDNKQELYKNESEYSLELIKLLCKDISLLHDKKIKEYKEKLKETPLYELTSKEAALIGKHEKWSQLFKRIYDFTIKHLPPIPNKAKIDYIEEEIKFQNKDDVTPGIMISLYKNYKDKSYSEIRADILKRRKDKKKKK